MNEFRIRVPTLEDGVAVRHVAARAGGLDTNPVYAYVALIRHFATTCVVAERDGRVEGFVVAHRIPERPNVLFVWQVGVAPQARRCGLATRMLLAILHRQDNRDLSWLETTITPSNDASQHLFEGLARRLGTTCDQSRGFSRDQLGGDHEPENLYRIGPFDRSQP